MALAVTLRKQEDARPKGERVHLGGDLIATFIGNGSIRSIRVYRWNDFDEHWLAMNNSLLPQMSAVAAENNQSAATANLIDSRSEHG